MIFEHQLESGMIDACVFQSLQRVLVAYFDLLLVSDGVLPSLVLSLLFLLNYIFV